MKSAWPANAVEAAEQSGRLTVPEIREAVQLGQTAGGLAAGAAAYFCDEGGDAKPLAQAARESRGGPPPFSPARKAASIRRSAQRCARCPS